METFTIYKMKRPALSLNVFSLDGIFLDVAEERLKAGESITDFRFNKKRVRVLQGDEGELARECKVRPVSWLVIKF